MKQKNHGLLFHKLQIFQSQNANNRGNDYETNMSERKKHQSSFKSGAAATHTAKWTLSETMSFLDDHLKPRSTASNIVVVDVENDEPSCSTSAELNESLSSTSG
ncbi:uncharacterized protein LOC144746880 [Ciona intestinalis]